MDFSKRILVGLTGRNDKNVISKLKEIKKFKITKAALFLESIKENHRKKIYKALSNFKIKLPVVHIKNGMKKEELVFLTKKFRSSYLTIHEDSFKILDEWKGFYKKLYLEMNFDNFIPHSVNVHKIGGFCVDLSHFKVEEEKWSKEFLYIIKRRRIHRYFACNHLNGYSYSRNKDIHTIRSLRDFDYLKTLPKFLFSKNIALETFNPISEQLKFKEYLTRMLNKLF